MPMPPESARISFLCTYVRKLYPLRSIFEPLQPAGTGVGREALKASGNTRLLG
jgi:hypothetical protein